MTDQFDVPAGDGLRDATPPPRVPRGLLLSPLTALLAVAVYASTSRLLTSDFLDLLSVGALCAAAALTIGGLAGFLFGIPRRLQREGAPVDGGALAVNTNLEQISDWLTKIIVGVGLVQLGRIADGLHDVAASISLGDRASSETFCLALLLYGLVDGFLLGYVWTRLELSALLATADALLQPEPEPNPLPPAPPGI